MKRLVKRALTAVLAAMLLVLTLAACDVKLDNLDDVVAVFDDESIELTEAKLFVYHSQKELEEANQFIVLYYYGGYDSFWKNSSMWESNLVLAMQKAYQQKLLAKTAASEGFTLTAEEEEKVEHAIVDLRTNYPKIMDYSEADIDLIRAFYRENALANKYRLYLMEGVDTTFEEEVYRRKKLEGLSIMAKTTVPQDKPEESEEPTEAEPTDEAPDTDVSEESAEEAAEEAAEEPTTEEPTTEEPTTEEPTTEEPTTEAVPYSSEEQEANRKAAEEEITALLKEGKSVSDIVAKFTDSKTVTVASLGSVTLKPEDDKKEDEEGYSAYKALGWGLANDEVGSVTSTGSSGSKVTYAVRMVNDNDPDLRKEAEDTELATRKAHLFSAKYAEIVKKNKKFHVYTEKLANLKYKGAILSSITVTGDDFADLEEDETGESGTED